MVQNNGPGHPTELNNISGHECGHSLLVGSSVLRLPFLQIIENRLTNARSTIIACATISIGMNAVNYALLGTFEVSIHCTAAHTTKGVTWVIQPECGNDR